MSVSIKGTQTEKNLLKSFAGESQARNRYTFFAKVAREEGFKQIESFFLETAENERVHAKLFFKHLEGGPVEITAVYPAGKVGTTEENLLASANGEHEEYSELYPAFAKTAKGEGFNEIAALYTNIAKIEAHHEARYRRLLANVQAGSVFKKAEKVQWLCLECGHVHEGESAPNVCPVCKHPQAYFELLKSNF